MVTCVFIVTGFICSNTEAKQIVLINHRWTSPRPPSPHFPKEMGVGVLTIFPQNGKGCGKFFPKKEEI